MMKNGIKTKINVCQRIDVIRLAHVSEIDLHDRSMLETAINKQYRLNKLRGRVEPNLIGLGLAPRLTLGVVLRSSSSAIILAMLGEE